MDKDKEILFSQETQQKFAELLAKWLMPDMKYLEELSNMKTETRVTSWEKDGKWVWESKIEK